MTVGKGRFAVAELLRFMLDAAEAIEVYVADVKKQDFLDDTVNGRMIREAVVYNLGVLGEVANDICRHYPDIATNHPEIPFSRIYAMRNHIFHGYHSIVTAQPCRKAGIPRRVAWMA